MNQPGIQFLSASRALAKRWPWALGLILGVMAIAGPLSGSDVDNDGASPYAPTRGEWLCLLLNTQEALFSREQQPDDVAVRYLYNRSQPNKIQIALLYSSNVNAREVRRQAKFASEQAVEAAKLRGWDKWLKVELTQTQLSGRPPRQILDQ